MPNMPDRLSIDKKDKKLYDALVDEIFQNKERKDQFLLAMAIGYKNGLRQPLLSREGFFRTEYLKEIDKALIFSLSVKVKGSLLVLSDITTVYQLAEEYAHGGIKLIYDEVSSKQLGSFFKRYELILNENLGRND